MLKYLSSALESGFHNSRKLKPKPTIKGLTFIQNESCSWSSAADLKITIITSGCSNLQCSDFKISWCWQTYHFLELLTSMLVFPWSCWVLLTDFRLWFFQYCLQCAWAVWYPGRWRWKFLWDLAKDQILPCHMNTNKPCNCILIFITVVATFSHPLFSLRWQKISEVNSMSVKVPSS